MNIITEIVAFFLKNNPLKTDYSVSRLTKMIYLADWKSAIQLGKQISEIEWKIFYSGPYTDEVNKEIFANNIFRIENQFNPRCGEMKIVKIDVPVEYRLLTKEEMGILKIVIDMTSKLNWDSFLNLVYSTYPLLIQERYTVLNLPQLAIEYKHSKHELVFA